MNKRQIRKEGHKAIFKEGKSHSETFMILRGKSKIDGNTIADILSGIPSKVKHEETKILWQIYVGVLSLIVLFRLFYMYLVAQQFGLSDSVAVVILTTAFVFSVFVPILGIYGAITGRRHLLYGVAAFLIIGILRGIQRTNLGASIDTYVVFGLVAILLVLTIIIWSKWKTPYSKKIELIATDEGDKKSMRYVFEESSNASPDLLDDSL